MNEIHRKISIFIEVEKAIKYLRLGLAEVQKISSQNDFYDPVFIFLSGGLERLFKSMLCLSYIEKHGKLPQPNVIWKNGNGHDLLFLKSQVEEICVLIKKPNLTTDDYSIILNDKLINKICKTLSKFGSKSRYFNIDMILGVEQDFNSKKEWEKIETYILVKLYGKDKYYELIKDPKQLNQMYSDSNKEIVAKLEVFFRALTRQFMFGNFSKESKNYAFQIDDFIGITDNQLGMTDYGKFKNYERIERRN